MGPAPLQRQFGAILRAWTGRGFWGRAEAPRRLFLAACGALFRAQVPWVLLWHWMFWVWQHEPSFAERPRWLGWSPARGLAPLTPQPADREECLDLVRSLRLPCA